MMLLFSEALIYSTLYILQSIASNSGNRLSIFRCQLDQTVDAIDLEEFLIDLVS